MIENVPAGSELADDLANLCRFSLHHRAELHSSRGVAKSMGQAIEQRFHDVAAAVQKLRSRAANCFRAPSNSGVLKALEDRQTPRAAVLNRVHQWTRRPGIYYEDSPDSQASIVPSGHIYPQATLSNSATSDPTSSRRAQMYSIILRICSAVLGYS